jgi:hypothetical protein
MMGVLTRFKKEGDEYMVDENHGEGSGGVRRSAGSFHGRGIADFFGRFCPAKNLITRATAF